MTELSQPNSKSTLVYLTQGSCLGPWLFSVYTSEPFGINAKRLPSSHYYADDTRHHFTSRRPDNQLSYSRLCCSYNGSLHTGYTQMEDKSRTIKLNEEKSEFTLIGTKMQLMKTNLDGLVDRELKHEA